MAYWRLGTPELEGIGADQRGMDSTHADSSSSFAWPKHLKDQVNHTIWAACVDLLLHVYIYIHIYIHIHIHIPYPIIAQIWCTWYTKQFGPYIISHSDPNVVYGP